MSTLMVNEVYGPVWQGEGPSTGRVCSFVRLMGCNLDCAWTTPGGVSPCDESQTWDASRFDLKAQGTRLEASAITRLALAPFASPASAMVVVTGGEPLLHQTQPGWLELMQALDHAGAWLEVETNGTHIPDTLSWTVDQFNVSPKLSSSGVAADRRVNPEALRWFRDCGYAVFKFVCAGPQDLAEVADLSRAWSIPPHLVWIMPVGVTAGEILDGAQALAHPVLRAGYNLTLRQQWLVHGPEGEPRT